MKTIKPKKYKRKVLLDKLNKLFAITNEVTLKPIEEKQKLNQYHTLTEFINENSS